MSIKQRLKLLSSLFLLGIICFGLVLYVNASTSEVGDTSASLVLPAYTVGTDFDGVVTQQYVSLGDKVKTGQKLFEVKSDQLTAELASGELKISQLSAKLAPDGGLILTAQHAAVVSEIDDLQGSFVISGKPIAVLTGLNTINVQANFNLSTAQYSQLLPTTTVKVTVGGQTMDARITGITQSVYNNKTVTSISAILPKITSNQTVYASGTPANVHLALNSNPLYKRVEKFADSVKSSVI